MPGRVEGWGLAKHGEQRAINAKVLPEAHIYDVDMGRGGAEAWFSLVDSI